MNNSTQMANREVADLIFLDYATQKPFLNLDYANVTTTELTGESVFAYGGKSHPKKVQFSGEKGGTLTIETQMQTVALWQLITGGDVTKAAQYVVRKEFVLDSSKQFTITDTFVAGSVVVFAEGDDCGQEISVEAAESVITVSGKSEGDKVIAYYMKKVDSGVVRINIKSTSFPKAFTVYGDTIMKTENDEVLPYRLIAYKLVPQSQITIGMSNTGDPQTLSIQCDLMENSSHDILDLILEEE